MTHPRYTIWVLAALTMLAPFSIDTYLPAFPAIAEALHGSDLSIQQSLTVYLLAYTVMTLFYGAISDSIGRLRTIKIGLTIFTLASIGCALSQNVAMLLLFRTLQGLSGGAGNVVARAMVRDLYSGAKAQKMMAQVQVLFGIAPAIAPIIGGYLLHLGWQYIFVFLALYASTVMYTARVFLPETVASEPHNALSLRMVLNRYRTLFADSQFRCLVMALGASFCGFFIYVLAAPVFLLKHLNLAPHQFGYMFIPTVTCMITGSWLAQKMAGKYPTGKMLRLAYAWMSTCICINILVCFLLPRSMWWAYIAPVACYNIGLSFVMPFLSVAALDRNPQARGTAASGQAFIQMLLIGITSGVVLQWIWGSPLTLALGAMIYLATGLVLASRSSIWKR